MDMKVPDLKVEALKPALGAVIHCDRTALFDPEMGKRFYDLLEERGVLIFPKVNLSDKEQLAAYGGADFVKRQVDDAYYSTAQVGSSFKPYVLATALKNGISLKTVMNGKSPQYFTTKGDSVAAGTPGERLNGMRSPSDVALPAPHRARTATNKPVGMPNSEAR